MMLRHVKFLHVKRRPYSCSLCKFAAIERAFVRKHLQKEHRKKGGNIMTNAKMVDYVARAVRTQFVIVDPDGNEQAHSGKRLYSLFLNYIA